MISVDGFGSLAAFYVAAQRSIRLRLRPELDRRDAGGGARPAGNAISANVRTAAKFLVHDLFGLKLGTDGAGAVAILRPDGSRALLNIDLLEPAEEVSKESLLFSEAREKYFGGRWPAMMNSIFGLKSLRSEYWIEPFIDSEVFSLRERRLHLASYDVTRCVPVVDWQMGVLKLTELNILANSLEKIYDANAAMKAIGVEIGGRFLSRGAEARIGTPMEVLKLLSPYDGCTLVAPDFWVDELFDDLREPPDDEPPVDKAEKRADRAPKDAILDLFSENPFLKKADFKRRLFPNLSTRQFDWHWRQAAEIAPEISKAGRRPAKS